MAVVKLGAAGGGASGFPNADSGGRPRGLTGGEGELESCDVALRIEDEVVRGEIDNSVEGRTAGWLWLVGRAEPVLLELEGDCWRDLAGARLKFSNPDVRGEGGVSLASVQRGLVGDMTASRKARLPVGPAEEGPVRFAAGEGVPTVLKNTLYLEWFSETDGRVVLETGDFELEISDREWSMDEDAEEAQKLANLQAMRDFMDRIIARRPPVREGVASRDDEFEWEERLKESDRLTDAYQEVMEKYMDDPDAEQKEAFVMGWDGLLEAMADEDEGRESQGQAWQVEEGVRSEMEEDGWDEADDGDFFQQHPLQAQAQELALRAFDLVRDEANGGDEAAAVVSGELMKVAAKLAGALNGTYEQEAGYVLAILKRCLSWLNEVLDACGKIIQCGADADQVRAVEAVRDEVFMLRQKITEMRRELRGS